MDSRQAERISVSARGSFRRGAGLAQTVTFADLTREGCRLIDIPRSLSRGERISLRIGNVGPIVAQVCWLRLGREAGLAFEQPLSEQVYDLLTTQARVQMQSAYRAEIMGLHNSFTPEKSAVEDPETPDNVVPLHSDIEPDADRRIDKRTASNEPAILIDAVQQATEVRLVDVSTSGMRLSHEGTLPAVGAILELVFADHRIARGEVRWAEDGQIGLHVVPEIEEAALAENEPVAEPATPTALPDLPKDQLTRFMDLFEAAKLSGFSVVKLRVDADAIEMVVSTDPAR